MVRTIVERTYDNNLKYIEAAGLSTDAKPTGGIVTGSLFLEVDAMKLYAYDETDTGSWGNGVQLGSGS